MTVILVLIFIVGSVIFASVVASANKNRQAEETRLRRKEREQAEVEFLSNRQKFSSETFGDWPFVSPAEIDGASGLIGMDAQGVSVRIVVYERADKSLASTWDQTIATKNVTAVKIDQPTRSRVVTHNDLTPVAVTNSRGSPVGRALVGGAIAGPLGVVAGGLSGAAVKSTVEHVGSKRNETVYYKGHPLLILEFDDLFTPRRTFRFDTVKETNDWSSRFYTAINRAKAIR